MVLASRSKLSTIMEEEVVEGNVEMAEAPPPPPGTKPTTPPSSTGGGGGGRGSITRPLIVARNEATAETDLRKMHAAFLKQQCGEVLLPFIMGDHNAVDVIQRFGSITRASATVDVKALRDMEALMQRRFVGERENNGLEAKRARVGLAEAHEAHTRSALVRTELKGAAARDALQAGQKLRHRHARRRVNPGVALLPPQDQRPERRQPRRHPRDGHAPLGPQAVLAQVEVTQLQERPEAGRDRGRSIVAKPVLAAGTA